MNDHAHREYATTREVDGFGKRVGKVETSQAEEKAKTTRNAEDIQRLFDLAEKNATNTGKVGEAATTAIHSLELATTAAIHEVDVRVGAMRWQITGAVAAAVTILGLVWKVLDTFVF
jgi:hypothetical protein